MHGSLPPGKSLPTSSLLPATSPVTPAHPRPQTEDGTPALAVSLPRPLLPCLGAALGSTVPVTAPVCRWQPGTRCPMARGCPPRLPSSCHHPNCPVFLGQTAKTASAARRKGELSPLVWAESLGSAQRMQIPLPAPNLSLPPVTLGMAASLALRDLRIPLRDWPVPGIPQCCPAIPKGRQHGPEQPQQTPHSSPSPELALFSPHSFTQAGKRQLQVAQADSKEPQAALPMGFQSMGTEIQTQERGRCGPVNTGRWGAEGHGAGCPKEVMPVGPGDAQHSLLHLPA